MIKSNIKKYLKLSGLTQRELAERSGITEASVSRYVNGERVPNALTCIRIAKILNCKAEDLIDAENAQQRMCNIKEFVEKLINRLEEYKYSHLVEHDSEQCKHCQEKGTCCELDDCSLCIWDKAKEIVNQFAEEYKSNHNDHDMIQMK